jgi:hypothetical protein
MARAAIESAKKTGTLGGVFHGFGELDDILNGIARLLWFQRSRWTRAQRQIAGLLRQGMSQTQVAKKLRIRKQVVSRQVLSSGYFPYAAGDWAWRMILDKQVRPSAAFETWLLPTSLVPNFCCALNLYCCGVSSPTG